MDFEEQLDLFFIRKEDESTPATEVRKVWNSKQIHHSKDVFKYIPLLLKHVENLNENSLGKDKTNVIKIFSNKIQFKHCLVYGRIISRGKDSKGSYNYVLDDGTATLDIRLFEKNEEMKDIWKLENELQAVKRDMLAQNKNEIVDSLRNLLFTTKEQMDYSNIKMGSKVLVYGKPNHFRGKTSLTVYSLMKDKAIHRDLEIAFKDYLINWYINNCMVLTNSSLK